MFPDGKWKFWDSKLAGWGSRALRSLYYIKALSATGSFRRVQQGMVGTVEND